MVQENGDAHVDEAAEKMLSNAEGAEVKFISGDRTNGDAKVDVECLQQVFTGMGKEELMKYAKDPFWVRLRWTLFVLFWLLWTAMLVGAIVIVIAAPKCAAPVPKTWWEEGPLIDIDLSDAAKDESNIFKNLKDIGSNSIVLRIPDNYDLYKDNFTYADIRDVIKKAKSENENLHVVLEIQANFVPKENKMFMASENRDSEYADYFIWSDGKVGDEPKDKVPNNWKATVNGSAWNKSDKRNQYYLSQFGDRFADLNFGNTNVRNIFAEALENLVNTGISGIKLRYAKHLLIDETLMDEAFSSAPGFVHNDYGFYNHLRTSNQAGLGELVQPWKEIVHNNTESGVFYIAEDIDRNTFEVDSEIIPQLPSASKKLIALNRDAYKSQAKDIYTSLKSLDSETSWPHLHFSSQNVEDRSEHNILLMLLPGVPELSKEQLLGLNNSLVNQSKVLLTARQNPSVKYGSFNVQLFANETVVGYSRLKPGNPGLIVLYNTEQDTSTVNLEPLLGKVESVTVMLLSNKYNEEGVTIKGTLPASTVPISPRAAILLSYIPASEN
ncbi:neutral and basic amino acid transport protein rBAT isoform X2 [Ctenocephalides felis]|nr:neutral and basic amino acid transport protein rBAT isoform X2 [Ctenocephalides felis]